MGKGNRRIRVAEEFAKIVDSIRGKMNLTSAEATKIIMKKIK